MERDGNSLGTQVESYVSDDLHRAMLSLWDRLKELASMSEPSDTEITIAIEEFSIAWQMSAGIETSNGSEIGNGLHQEQVSRNFARLLYKRLRLQYQEFARK